MYKLGTTLIFTSLTQASAAADLFGKKHVKPFQSSVINGEFIPKQFGQWQTADRWELVLDTEEKVQWFTVQVGDFIADGIIGGVVKRVLSDGVDYETCCATNFCHSNSIKILYRDGKPFPQPQEIRHD